MLPISDMFTRITLQNSPCNIHTEIREATIYALQGIKWYKWRVTHYNVVNHTIWVKNYSPFMQWIIWFKWKVTHHSEVLTLCVLTLQVSVQLSSVSLAADVPSRQIDDEALFLSPSPSTVSDIRVTLRMTWTKARDIIFVIALFTWHDKISNSSGVNVSEWQYLRDA